MFYYDTRECELLHLQHSDDKVCVLIQISFHWKISFCWVLSRLYLIVSLNSKLQSLHQSCSALLPPTTHKSRGTIQTKYKSKYQTQIYNIHWISKQYETFVCALKARVVFFFIFFEDNNLSINDLKATWDLRHPISSIESMGTFSLIFLPLVDRSVDTSDAIWTFYIWHLL